MDSILLKEKVCKCIDENKDKIIEIGEKILNNPELGFKEKHTSELVSKVFASLNIETENNIALTGVKALAEGRSHNLKIAIIGEMDAVLCPDHPKANIDTGAAHSCGHNAQIASMLGAAFGLVLSGGINELDGDIEFVAVPAEEFVELEYRDRLRNQGCIKYFSGKQELISLGFFDHIDIAMMVHSQANVQERKVYLNGGSSGFLGKNIRYIGKASHAGGSPHEGINALNSAMIALMSINALRETFKDEDAIRVHPIITKGGDLVNVVPADVRLETYVRGKSISAITSTNSKVDRAFKAGAYAIGSDVIIQDIPGYLPLNQDVNLSNVFEDNIKTLVGSENIIKGVDMIGSTDMGNLSSLIPIIQPTIGGFKGSAHSKDFEIVDPYMAYIVPAKAMAMTAVDLLYDGAEVGKSVKSQFKPQLTKEEYFTLMESMDKSTRYKFND